MISEYFVPTEPGEYFCQPFWGGKNTERKEIKCYIKNILIQDDVGYRDELVCDYKGSTHLVALTAINKWEKG